MEANWAAEHLQIIRTLMERSAVYRRALAPVMIFIGTLGASAAFIGWAAEIESPRAFIVYWVCVCGLTLSGSFLLVRRQALKAAEPFWSPPTRRVTQAMLPPLVAGLIVSAVIYVRAGSAPSNLSNVFAMLWLPIGWVILYGCAFHSAGFFMPRGMRIFGWALVLGASGVFAIGTPGRIPRLDYAHGLMGLFFGLVHLAYGFYLYFTEKHRHET